MAVGPSRLNQFCYIPSQVGLHICNCATRAVAGTVVVMVVVMVLLGGGIVGGEDGCAAMLLGCHDRVHLDAAQHSHVTVRPVGPNPLPFDR
jgi:hypothetical protein